MEIYSVVEDVCPPGSVIVESFVHDVPAVALPLPIGHLVFNVVLQGCDESCVCPGTGSD